MTDAVTDAATDAVEDLPVVRGPRCSDLSREYGESLSATAPYARGWLIVEQPGPWGRRALLESRLPAGLGERLTARAEGTGTTVLLARRPDRSGEARATSRRRFWVAHTSPGGVRMRSGVLDDVAVLGDLDLDAVARGELPPYGSHDRAPALFVCSNAKRDVCCAAQGRALVAALLARGADPFPVYEVSHLGGHRFAPTVLMLPWGTVHGRLTADDAVTLLDDARDGRLSLTGYRGRSAFRRWAQAAEIAVRQSAGVTGIDDLDVLRVGSLGKVVPVAAGPGATPDEPVQAEVRHVDGRAWRVDVERRLVEPARPESCEGEPVTPDTYVVTAFATHRAWR